jgi:signal transduction histidine kinase
MGANPKIDAQNPAFQQENQVNQPSQQQGTIAQRQVQRNIKEYEARAQTLQQMAGNTSNNPLTNFDNSAGINRFNILGDVREGVMKAVWLGGELVLARRVAVGGREYIQGAWLDWPAIRQWLLESVKDLVPQADLAPVRPDTPADRSGWRSTDIGGLMGREGYLEEPGRLLATLPVRLVPGAVAPETEEGLSPLGLSLIVAWACVLLAGVAVVVLLWGTVALSERRAAFVSAVTHELRTPLTTFRMYSEMLAGGMVADEAKRRRYLDTLRIEADRLVHLVENVLAYARLERGRARGRTETVRLADLVGRIGPRLAERAGQAGFEFVVEGAGADAAVRADPSAVEQILFNLVDNACKYAAGAADKRIHLVARAAGGRAALEVCDHGPGLSARDARRLFRPFSKSARQAAHSAPGVGLGLALSRRLAREMGGDLTLIPRPDDGACFALFLSQG